MDKKLEDQDTTRLMISTEWTNFLFSLHTENRRLLLIVSSRYFFFFQICAFLQRAQTLTWTRVHHLSRPQTDQHSNGVLPCCETREEHWSGETELDNYQGVQIMLLQNDSPIVYIFSRIFMYIYLIDLLLLRTTGFLQSVMFVIFNMALYKFVELDTQ